MGDGRVVSGLRGATGGASGAMRGMRLGAGRSAAARLWMVDQGIAALTAERVVLLRLLRGVSGGGGVGGGGLPVLPGAAVLPAVVSAERAVLLGARLGGAAGRLSIRRGGLGFVGGGVEPAAGSESAAESRCPAACGGGGHLCCGEVGRAGGWWAGWGDGGCHAFGGGCGDGGCAACVACDGGVCCGAGSGVVDCGWCGASACGACGGIAPATYAGAVSAVIALLAAAWVAAVRLRTLRIAALVAAELVVPLLTGTSVVRPAGVAAVYGLQVVALLAFRFQSDD